MSTTRNRRLSLESLDDGPLSAGQVTAVLSSPSMLTINEAAGYADEAGCISISRQPDGQIRIDGRSQSGRPSSLVNGYAYRDFAIPTGGLTIVANLGGGSDTLRILPGMRLGSVVLSLGETDIDTADINFADSFLMS